MGAPSSTDMLRWVTGDPEALRAAAAGWTDAASKVKETHADLDSGLEQVVDNWSGEAYNSFAEYMGDILKELGKQETAMLQIAAKLTDIANALATARDKVIRILVRLATALIPLAALAFILPGPGTATALGAAIGATAAAVSAIIMVTQALAGVLQGVPDVLNDLEGNEFALNSVGQFPDALPEGVPVGKWGPESDSPDTGARPEQPTGSGRPMGGVPSGSSAPTAPGTGTGTGTGMPTMPPPATPMPMPTPPVPGTPTGPPCVPVGGVVGSGAGMDSGLPPDCGWAPPGAPLPEGWHQDVATGQILPPSAAPSGPPPAGLLPGYGWIAPGVDLPAGWRIDAATDVLVGPAAASGTAAGPDQAGPAQGSATAYAPHSSGWEAAVRPGGSAFATNSELATAPAGATTDGWTEQDGGMGTMPPTVAGAGDSDGDWCGDATVDPALLEGVPA